MLNLHLKVKGDTQADIVNGLLDSLELVRNGRLSSLPQHGGEGRYAYDFVVLGEPEPQSGNVTTANSSVAEMIECADKHLDAYQFGEGAEVVWEGEWDTSDTSTDHAALIQVLVVKYAAERLPRPMTFHVSFDDASVTEVYALWNGVRVGTKGEIT